MDTRIVQCLSELLKTTSLNRLPSPYTGDVFSAPLLGVARADDPLFAAFKQVVAADHMTPVEAWLACGLTDEPELATRLRVVSLVFPFSETVRQAGRANAQPAPTEVYCLARNWSDAVMHQAVTEAISLLRAHGHRAVSPTTSGPEQLTLAMPAGRIHANWSERHVAFAAGMGTFSLSEALITEAGCNVRLASIITDCPLEPTGRPSDEVHANCLHFASGSCGLCISKCPVGAISSAGHDKMACLRFEVKLRQEMNRPPLAGLLKPFPSIVNGQDKTGFPVGCALCQFGVPCENSNPCRPDGFHRGTH